MPARPREARAGEDVRHRRLGRDDPVRQAGRGQEVLDERGAGACVTRRIRRVDAGEILKESDEPVLIGLDNQPSIVKPYAEGDETQSFEALYESA